MWGSKNNCAQKGFISYMYIDHVKNIYVISQATYSCKKKAVYSLSSRSACQFCKEINRTKRKIITNLWCEK